MTPVMQRLSRLDRHLNSLKDAKQDIELGEISSRNAYESVRLLDTSPGDDFEDAGPSHVRRATIRKQPLGLRRRRQGWFFEALATKVRFIFSHVLMILGFYQVMLISWSLLDGICPDDATSVMAAFGLDHHLHRSAVSINDPIQPIMCHSHNDYWRARPLYTAIEMGCTGVEADIWLEDGDLLVAHTRSTIYKNRTLESLYISPILEILDRRNPGAEDGSLGDDQRDGIFYGDPAQSLILLIDFKVESSSIWPILVAQLEPLRQRQYLTYFNGQTLIPGPVTVVASGEVAFEDVVRDTTHRDIFFDAPLDMMGRRTPQQLDLSKGPDNFYEEDLQEDPEDEGDTIFEMIGTPMDYRSPDNSKRPTNAAVYSPINSYYASVSFMHSIGYPWHSRLSHDQIELIRSQIRGAHERGLKVRYWGVPAWPLGVRNYLWRVLVREGADVLSVDDVEAVTKENWGPKKGGWNRKWWP